MKIKTIISLLLGIVIISGCSNSSMASQEKCSTQAKIFFDNYKKSPVIEDYSYQNHFSNKLDKCYVLIHGSGTSGESSQLWDAYENKVVAECEYYAGSIQMNFCGYSGSSDKYDIEKFNNFIKQYMEK
ncbi:MAG: hypothetical protein NT116_06330 [Candidatus Parcubacteria bacterium]|nr:hypothetical protein [Candidatus Parcubacteria bacterium]